MIEIEILRKHPLEETTTTWPKITFLRCLVYTAFCFSTWSQVSLVVIVILPCVQWFEHCLTVSTIAPVIMVWLFPGASWFHHQLIPSTLPAPTASLEPRTLMAMWQLTNCRYIEHEFVAECDNTLLLTKLFFLF